LEFVDASYSGCSFVLPVRCQDERSNLINVPMLIPVMGMNSAKAFRRSRPRFQRFRFAIARLRIRYQRLE
jgi:hypothetical protein